MIVRIVVGFSGRCDRRFSDCSTADRGEGLVPAGGCHGPQDFGGMAEGSRRTAVQPVKESQGIRVGAPKIPKIVLPLFAGEPTLPLEKMTHNHTARAPGKSAMRLENRAWGFLRNDRSLPLENRRRCPEPCRKSRPTSTIFTPGIPQWPSRDPIGERGGVNLYGFVGNEGVSRLDVLGEGAIIWDGQQGSSPNSPNYPDPPKASPEEQKRALLEKKFRDWYDQEQNLEWVNELPDCPCDISCIKTRCSSSGSWNPYVPVREVAYQSVCAPEGWDIARMDDARHLAVYLLMADFHPGALYEMRKTGKNGISGQQCMYDANGKLITKGVGAGSVDKASPNNGVAGHKDADVDPAVMAMTLDGNPSRPDPNGKYFNLYMKVRPANKGKDAKGSPCPDNP